MSIYLIRHAETPGNAGRILQHPHIPLSPRGEAQAERLARRLANVGIVSILSSDMARAAMTAQHVARATGLAIQFEPLLHERNFGDIRGTRYDDLGFDPFDLGYAPPNGESWDVFHARVDRAWARIQDVASATDGHLAVVTHGLVCRSLAGRCLTLPEGQGVPQRWENTSVTILEDRAPWRVELLNCCAHLDDLTAASAAGPA